MGEAPRTANRIEPQRMGRVAEAFFAAPKLALSLVLVPACLLVFGGKQDFLNWDDPANFALNPLVQPLSMAAAPLRSNETTRRGGRIGIVSATARRHAQRA